MWRAASRLAIGAAILGGGATAAAVATSDDPSTTLKICTIVPVRLLCDSLTVATIVADYQYSCWGLKEGSPEWSDAKHEAHKRGAYRLLDLCFRNGGIYIKLGQHISQLEYVVPEEYVQIMRASMLKRCPVSSYEQVCNVVIKELGEPPEKAFAEFDPKPLASASLAQVHAARTHDGQKVAVKVQHLHLTDTAIADIATVDFLVNFLHWCFPAFDYRWLVDEVRESIPKELEFLHEARNSIKCLDNFRRLSPHTAHSIYAPKIYWNLSTSRLLTMEFMDAPEITDLKAIRRLGLEPYDVSKLVSQAFAEMIFKHGFVHCDPHAANMMVRPLPSSKWNIFDEGQAFGVTTFCLSDHLSAPDFFFFFDEKEVSPSWSSLPVFIQDEKFWRSIVQEGRNKPQLILLDHGLYRELDSSTRTNYAALWKGLVFADADAIKDSSVKLGAGEDLYILFAGIVTMRPWRKVIDPSADHLVVEGNDDDRSELQMYAARYFPQISELLRRLPRVILLMLKTNDCLRSVNHALLQGSSLDTFFIIGKIASQAVLDSKKVTKGGTFFGCLCIWLEEFLLEARMLGLRMAMRLLQLKNSHSQKVM